MHDDDVPTTLRLQRRLHTLVDDANGRTSLDRLARWVAQRESNRGTEPTPEHVRTVRREPSHDHLPTLEAHGAVTVTETDSAVDGGSRELDLRTIYSQTSPSDHAVRSR